MDQPAGIDAVVLAEHAVAQVRVRTADMLTPGQLSDWLLTQELAVRLADGRLWPTRAAVELAAGLRRLEGDDPHPRTWLRRRQ